jgi:hypothetical protein
MATMRLPVSPAAVLIGGVAILLAAALRPAPVRAQAAKPPYDPRVAFSETDTNHDGAIDRDEFDERMTNVFFLADTNKDGTLSPAECAATLVQTGNLGTADSNHDGRLTLHEFLRARARDFDRVDTNADGLLELDEVIVVFEKATP